MVAYTAAKGQRRKPAIGRFGANNVGQDRATAQDWLAQVRCAADSSAERVTAGAAPNI